MDSTERQEAQPAAVPRAERRFAPAEPKATDNGTPFGWQAQPVSSEAPEAAGQARLVPEVEPVCADSEPVARADIRSRSELLFNLLLVPVDTVMLATGFAVGHWLAPQLWEQAENPATRGSLEVFLLLVPFVQLAFAATGLYSLSNIRSTLKELRSVLLTLAGALLSLALLDLIREAPLLGVRGFPLLAFCAGVVTVAAGRQAVRSAQRSLLRRGVGAHRVLLVGAGPVAKRVADELPRPSMMGYEIVGVVSLDATGSQSLAGIRIDRTVHDVLERMGGLRFEEIIHADPAATQQEILDLLAFAGAHNLTYSFVPNQIGLVAASSSVSIIAGMPMVVIERTPLDGWARVFKRGADVVASCAGLLALAPVFLVIAVAIRMADRGPTFYGHNRLGRGGRTIRLNKFRTMKPEYSTGPGFTGRTDREIFAELGMPELALHFEKEQKLADDPRVTGVGRFLRRTSLDELPQLVNVLRGDISLVGPRPIVKAELVKYGPEQAKLLTLRPGMTGLWQISGRNNVAYEDRVKLDIFYVENWSPLLDLRILLRTFRAVMQRSGAY